MVTGTLKNYTDENIIELIESLKTKSISYNLSDLKAVLAEVNNRKLEGDYAEVLGELIRDKILNGDIVENIQMPEKLEESDNIEKTTVAPAVKDKDLEPEEEKLSKKDLKEQKKAEKIKAKEDKKIKTVQETAKNKEKEDDEYEDVEKYPVLNFLTGFLKFVGWLSLVVSIIRGLYTSVTQYLSTPGAAIGSIFSGLLIGTVILLLCYWKSESISLKLDMEEHLNKIAGDK